MRRKKNKQHTCANCNFQFSTNSEHTNFCPNCGQENHNPRFPLVHYGYELLEGLLHFDTKFFYSLKTLLFRPGKITFDYIHNIRGRYTPPFRMFIFLSLFGLLVMGLYETNLLKKGLFGEAPDPGEKNMTISQMFDKAADSIKDNILVPPFSWVMKNPDVTNGDLRILKKMHKDSIGIWLSGHGYANNVISRLFAVNKKVRISRQMTMPEAVTMVTGIFKWLFLIMIPINAFICLIVFYRKGLFYYDAMLFSIHFGCFFLVIFPVMLLCILLLQSLSSLLISLLALLFLLTLLVYLAVSMKKVFAFGWLSTLTRMLVACLLAFAVFQLLHYFISNHSGR
ncbi:MAG TPA: DUF3667 domain-containing protein [Ferruginibacter sp.]|nr:DUF3667 domain-containing protein [Ferruginibacter sp.]